MLKTCTKCKEEKELDQFAANVNAKDGLQYSCRICCSERKKISYQKNRQHYIDKSKSRKESLVEAYKNIKRTKACVTCGETHIACLDFHHTSDDKEFAVANIIRDGGTIQKLLAEIAKCEVLCANCHRKHHYKP